MGMNDTLYNLYAYSYINNLLQQMRTSYAGASQYLGVGGTGSQSFADMFLSASGQISAPETMDAIFEEAAQLYDVPVQLLKAIGKAESGFDANAVSAAGAQGVMQLMPSTAKALGVDDPFDARSNIMGGAKYIAEKLKQYNGDMELALAAYNAGSGNVEKYGGVPPFSETRNYIQKIKEYMGMDLTTGKMVAGQSGTASSAASGILQGTQGSTYTGFSSENALYLAELMKLQLQSRVNLLSQSLTEEDDKNGNFWQV